MMSFPENPTDFVALRLNPHDEERRGTTLQYWAEKYKTSSKRRFVIIGGGIIGCSIAYYLTHHRDYDPELHHVIIVEACDIASAASGKAGGFVGSWATPRSPNLGELSFRLHKELADQYGGEACWGFRHCKGWDVKWNANKITTCGVEKSKQEIKAGSPPPSMNWLKSDVIESYELLGRPDESAQVNPSLLTKKLAKLAESKGADIMFAKAETIKLDPADNGGLIVYVSDPDYMTLLHASDVIVAAGPWTTRMLPELKLGAPRSHSVVVRVPDELPADVLFPIYDQENSDSRSNGTFPEIYPRPRDSRNDFGTIYACGPDDHGVLGKTSADVQIDGDQLEELRTALKDVSPLFEKGQEIAAQACHKPQLREHKENEDVGPVVGPIDGARGLWVATGHDEWGISNGPGTGLVMAEMLFEGGTKSLQGDVDRLHPRQWMTRGPEGLELGLIESPLPPHLVKFYEPMSADLMAKVIGDCS